MLPTYNTTYSSFYTYLPRRYGLLLTGCAVSRVTIKVTALPFPSSHQVQADIGSRVQPDLVKMAYVYNSQLVRIIRSVDHRFTYPSYSAEFQNQDAFTLYHQVQQENGTSNADGSIGLPALGHALAGSAGTAISKLLLYPLDLAITRLQVQRQLRGPAEAPSAASEADVEYKSLRDAAEKIYKREGGLSAFYVGCATDISKAVIDAFLFFLAYNFLRKRAQRKLGSSHLPVYQELAVGVGAGSFSKFITTPIQQIVTRKQTAAMVAARDPTSSLPPDQTSQLSIKDIALQIREERGISGFWTGYNASVILTLNPALTFVLQNLLTKALPRSKRDNPGPKLVFLLAAISKAIASTITYPVSLAKTRSQIASSDPSPVVSKPPPIEQPAEKTEYPPNNTEPATSTTSTTAKASNYARKIVRVLINRRKSQLDIFRSLHDIYTKEGIYALYSGLEGEVLKGFLGHGLTMLLKERIHVLIISAYYLLLKLRKQWPESLGSARDQAVKEMGRVNAAAASFASEAGERAKNIGETVAEGAGNAAEGVKGALAGGEKK